MMSSEAEPVEIIIMFICRIMTLMTLTLAWEAPPKGLAFHLVPK